MLVHRQRIASLAMTLTMLTLALGCTPVSLPKFDDTKNNGVGGINGGTGTGGDNTDGQSTNPTPSPTPTATPVDYGTITWNRANVTLDEQISLTSGAVINNAFVVTGGIRSADSGAGLSRLATSFAITNDGSLQAGTALGPILVNGSQSGICSHGAYAFNNYLILAGGQTDQTGFQSNAVSYLLGGTWYNDSSWSNTNTVSGGRQDFGSAQDATHLYVIGGRTGTTTAQGTPTNSILVADVDNSGTVSNWRVAGTLVRDTLWPTAVAANNHLYVYGGRTDNNGTVLNTLTSYTIGSDGLLANPQTETTALTTGGTLPALFGAAAYTYNNRVYLVGGMDSSGQFADTYISVVGSNGRLSTWKKGTSLPDRVAQGAYASDGNGHFFLGGGAYEAGLSGGSTSLTNQLWYATVN